MEGRSWSSMHKLPGYTQEGAAAIQLRIIDLAKRRDIAHGEIRAEERGTWTDIMAGDHRIIEVD
jgi:hypothetical protein